MPLNLSDLEPINLQNAHRLEKLATLHFGYANSIDWSRDEKLIAVASSNGTWIHEAPNLKKPPFRLQDTAVNCWDVAFHPDNSRLATAEYERGIFLWDVNKKSEPSQYEYQSKSVAFSQDGTHLFIGTSKSNVVVMNPNDGSVITKIRCKTPDERYISNYYAEEKATIDNLLFITGKLLVAFSSWGSDIFLIDIEQLKIIHQLVSDPYYHIRYVSLLSDKKTFVASIAAEKVSGCRFWNIHTGDYEDTVTFYISSREPNSENKIWTYNYSDDYKKIIYEDYRTGETFKNSMWEWNNKEFTRTTSKTHIASLSGRVGIQSRDGEDVRHSNVWYGHSSRGLDFDATGRYLLTIGQVWDISELNPVKLLNQIQDYTDTYEKEILQMYSPNHQVISVSADLEANIYIRDADNGTLLLKLIGHDVETDLSGNTIIGAKFSADWKYLFSAGSDGSVRQWNLQDKSHKIIWQDKNQTVWINDISKDGQYIAFISQPKNDYTISYWTLHIIDLQKKQVIFLLRYVIHARFGQDSNTLFITIRDEEGFNRVSSFQLNPFKQLGRFSPIVIYTPRPHLTSDGEVVIIPAHKHLALWDWKQEKKLFETEVFHGEHEYSYSSALSPDSKIFALADGSTGAIQLWGVKAK